MGRKFKVICACMGAAIIATAMIGINLTRSDMPDKLNYPNKNVQVQTVDKAPTLHNQYSLIGLTEDEIFNKGKTSIFRGEVTDIQNIKIVFGAVKGEQSTNFQAIATIKIDKVYRGDEKAGDVVMVRLPCSIGTEQWVEDTEIISALRVGTKGIFMPLKYDEDDCWEELDGTVYLKSISDYGLMDGMRYAFLQTDRGIVYSRGAFTSLNAFSLDDVEKYVLEKI